MIIHLDGATKTLRQSTPELPGTDSFASINVEIENNFLPLFFGLPILMIIFLNIFCHFQYLKMLWTFFLPRSLLKQTLNPVVTQNIKVQGLC